MKKYLSSLLLCSSLTAATQQESIYTSGWWTGPLFASHARTLPGNSVNMQPYLTYYATQGNFLNNWSLESSPHFFSVMPSMFIAIGLTDYFEFSVDVPWLFNTFQGHKASGLGDVSLQVALQVMKDDNGGPKFDILFFLREYLPTGNFTDLRPESAGVDALGYGTYTTTVGVNGQKVFLMPNGRLFRLRLNASYELPAVAHVTGVNVYGGGIGTKGKVWLDSTLFLTVAHELQFTQNWVFACDYMYQHGGQGKFSGDPGLAVPRTGITGKVSNGYPSWDSFSVAPAIEYNFTANTALIAGVWISVAGRNNAAFIAPIIAFNALF